MPHSLADETVWARVEGDELIVTHVAARGATEGIIIPNDQSGPKRSPRCSGEPRSSLRRP